jgi:hypothetical protein
MGAKDMSLQGGMLHIYKNDQYHRHFVDLIYDQSSNQSLEETKQTYSLGVC